MCFHAQFRIQAGVGASFFDPVLGTYTGLIVSKTNNTFQTPNRKSARVKLSVKHIRLYALTRQQKILKPSFLTSHCSCSHPSPPTLFFHSLMFSFPHFTPFSRSSRCLPTLFLFPIFFTIYSILFACSLAARSLYHFIRGYFVLSLAPSTLQLTHSESRFHVGLF